MNFCAIHLLPHPAVVMVSVVVVMVVVVVVVVVVWFGWRRRWEQRQVVLGHLLAFRCKKQAPLPVFPRGAMAIASAGKCRFYGIPHPERCGEGETRPCGASLG